MSNASKLLNAIYDEKNLVRSDDSTSEIVRKHKLFKAITDAIANDELQRGRDYGGTEEDSIYNDLSECEELLFERSIMKHDSAARDYLDEMNPIDCSWWVVQKLEQVRQMVSYLEGLQKGFPATTLALEYPIEKLKALLPDEYPSHEDSE